MADAGSYIPSGSTAALRTAERSGYAARASHVRRSENPHSGPMSYPRVDLRTEEARQEMAVAWWRGWDRADGELASGGP